MHSSLTSLCLWSRTDSAGETSLKYLNIFFTCVRRGWHDWHYSLLQWLAWPRTAWVCAQGPDLSKVVDQRSPLSGTFQAFSVFYVTHTAYKFIRSMNSFNCLLLENPPSAPWHQFTCTGKCSHRLLNRFCFVIYPLRCVMSSSSVPFLFQYMESVTAVHMSCGDQGFAVQKLVTLTCE